MCIRDSPTVAKLTLAEAGVPDRAAGTGAELTDAVVLGRVVPRERLDLGRTKSEGLIERRFEITVVRGEDHEVDVGPLSFADHSERTKDVDALLTLALNHLIPVSTEEQTALTVVLVAVLQRSVSDSDPLVALPVGLLSLVGA